MIINDGSGKWWHCPQCGFECEREYQPSTCPLCKQLDPFKKGRREKVDEHNSYDDIIAELEKYEEGCAPLTTKSGYEE